MKNIEACLSHNTDDWKTPSNLYNALINKGFLDVCPFKSSIDLYDQAYKNQKLYMNPPFSELNRWVDYALKLVELNNVVWLLMPARTDTKYFSKLFTSKNIYEIVFFKGRLHFNDSKCAPFPTLLVKLKNRFIYYPSMSNITVEEFIDLYL